MKKINVVTAAVSAAALVAAVGLGLSFRQQTPAEQSSSAPSSQQDVLRTVIADRTRYIMREYQGHIAVFNEDGSVHSVYDVNVELLPEYDRVLLKDGIQITGDDELRARVEDYTS